MKESRQPLVADVVLIVFVTLIAYLPAFRNGFVLDDVLITRNALIRAGDGLYRFWFTTEAQDYYPVTSSFWWLQWRLWDNDPTGYHVVNVVLHAINAVLIGLVLQRLKIPGAWLAAMVFALHPVNVATVAWISEQKNTLSMLFSALAVLLYLRFDEENRWSWYGLSLAAFLLALLSKSAVVMLPVVLLGCVWWLHGRVRWTDFLRSVPFLVLSLVLGLVTMWFQHEHVLTKIPARTDGFVVRLLTMGQIVWFYLSKAVLPVNLMLVYPKWDISPVRWLSYVPITILVCCFWLLWRKRRTWGRPLLFGFGYFVVMLLPVLGFLDQGFYQYTLVADHWQYYSIAGAIALVVAGWESISLRVRGRSLRWPVSMAVLVLLGSATWMRGNVYKDNETLCRDNIAKNPGAWMAHYHLGVALWRAGKVEEAIGHYRQALQIRPDYSEARNNLGVALAETGDIDGAIAEFREALRLRPDNPEAHNNLALALARQGQVEEAIAHLEQVVQINPNSIEGHCNLANADLQAGRVDDAIGHYEQAVRLNPDYPGAHVDLGFALEQRGKFDEAVQHWEAALRLDPGNQNALRGLERVRSIRSSSLTTPSR